MEGYLKYSTFNLNLNVLSCISFLNKLTTYWNIIIYCITRNRIKIKGIIIDIFAIDFLLVTLFLSFIKKFEIHYFYGIYLFQTC